MAPNPLRGAFAFLLCALLAAPARAGDIALPTDGSVGTSGGQAGSLGGAGSVSGGGVSAIPQMTLGLTPTLNAGVAPAPAISGVNHQLNSAVSLNPPAGYVGHDASKPVHWPPTHMAPADGAAKVTPGAAETPPAIPKKKNPMTQVISSANPEPPAIDSPVKAAASAGELDARLLGKGSQGAAAKPVAEASLEQLYDGAREKTGLQAPEPNDDWDGGEETRMFLTFKDEARHGSGLSKSDPGKGGAKGAAGLEVPLPPSGPVFSKAWFTNAGAKLKTFVGGGWKTAFASNDAPELGPTVKITLPKKAAADGGAAGGVNATPGRKSETVVVRSERGKRFEANGYQVLFVDPAGAGVTVVEQPDAALSVRLEREQGDDRTEILRRHFKVFNELIETNFAALELIAQSSSKMTVKTARSVGSLVWKMSQDYAELTHGDEGRADEATEIQLELQRIAAEIDEAVKGLPDTELLPPKAVQLVMPIEKRSLHHYINQLHQKALDALGRGNNGSPANLTVHLGEGKTRLSKRSVSLVDLSENPIVKDGRAVAPGFKALLAAMSRSKDKPSGSLIMQDHQFWGHFQLGAHSAEIYSSFLPPDEGGMIRVRYQEWGTSYDNQTRLYYVGRLLHKAGFHVDQKNGFLTAVIDKDHASQTVDEMTDTFALVVQALHATVGLDFALPILVQGAKTSEEVGARIDEWVDTVIGEGTLPFYVHDDQKAMVSGWSEYQMHKRGRAALRASLDAKLESLGLPPIPEDARMGQRTIEKFVSDPIEAAIARGQLLLFPGHRLVRNPRYDPLETLAKVFAAESLAGARMAEVVTSLDPSLFQYETIGSIGGLTVERAQRRMDPDAWVTVYALRDPKTGQIGLARAEVSALNPGGRPATISPATLFSLLKAQGHPVAEFTPDDIPAGAAYFHRLLRGRTTARDRARRRFQGLAASPGHGRTLVARITYDKALAARGGYIFVAPYTTPDDLDAIKGSKAVITTSGGLLSHAAITTREMGIPAAILPRVDWKDGVASLQSFELGEARQVGDLYAREAKTVPAALLAEGSLVRLDPATGVVETFPAGFTAPLLDAAAGLERFDMTGDADALVEGLRRRASSQALQYEQKAVLVREVLAGLFSRALADPKVIPVLQKARAALPGRQDVLGQWAATSIDASFYDELESAAADLKDLREIARESLSTPSLERAIGKAETRVLGLRKLSIALGRPKAEMAVLDQTLTRLVQEGRERHALLLADEVAELKEHARMFPAATIETLPRLKAAIGKAKRRGMAPQVVQQWENQAAHLEDTRRKAMEKEAPTAIPLSAVLDVDVPWVGGKAAKLGEIAAVVHAAGGTMPPGVALTVHAYRRFLKEAGIDKKLEAIAADKKLSAEEKSNRARTLIGSAALSPDSGVGKEILDSVRASGLSGVMLAVRSSAVDEDGAEAAFAGAGDTHLYVAHEELLEHVKDVWISLWNARALSYRETKGLSTANLAQAVVIQAMAHSEVSGVAFTQDPVTGSSGRVIVNSAFGLGEGIVSGRVAPDQFTLSKSDDPREILPPMISDKKLAIIRGKDGKGTLEQKMPPEWRRRRSLTPKKLKKLVAVATALENHFGYALDIEFGFVGEELFILQARPVTVSGAEKKPEVPKPPMGSQMKPEAQVKPKQLMFVCTGNTCRSPMAAHIARERLQRHGRGDIAVVSRGMVVSFPGEAMNPQAVKTLQEGGLTNVEHEATQLTDQDIEDTTLVLTMTAAQAKELRRRYPARADRIFSLAEYTKVGGDVADPYGKDDDAYMAAAIEINDALKVLVSGVPSGK